MDRETIINLPKKLLKFVLAAKAVSWLINTAGKIYRMIPKFDKITGIDTDKLVKNHMSK